jgi:hypothetical protein
MPVILNASDCDFWLDVTALGACCEDPALCDHLRVKEWHARAGL